MSRFYLDWIDSEARLNNLISIYENCNKIDKSCNFKDEYKIEKLNGIYFFVKNKWYKRLH